VLEWIIWYKFAVGMWARGPQFIELHVRFGLGIVRYGWGAEAFDHRHVVGALTASASYPGFSDDPVDASDTSLRISSVRGRTPGGR
jgi:hypothetical protein